MVTTMERDSETPAPAAPLVKVIDVTPGGAEAAQLLAVRDDMLRRVTLAYALPGHSALVPMAQRLLNGDGHGR